MATADYVIVGAGSAGCVLANRLSEDPETRVLLLEAGARDRHPNIKIPAGFANQFETALDWNYYTDPEPHVDGRSLYIPRGKSVGGSSSMNAMLYVRGRPLDYDLWVRQGAPGWGWEDVLPYFLRSEDNSRGASEFHRTGGELRVEDQRSPRSLDRHLLDASVAAGIPRVDDYNGPEQDGVSMFQVTQTQRQAMERGRRLPAPGPTRPNLELATGATVLGVELEGERAVGVRYRTRRGGAKLARAEREVLLCAGAICSPQILMLSGIGPPDHLSELGIEARHELAGVGREPPGPPRSCLDALGGAGRADALRGREAQVPRRVAAAPQRPADLDRRRGRRLRPHPARPARRRHPVPHGRAPSSRITDARSSTATRW